MALKEPNGGKADQLDLANELRVCHLACTLGLSIIYNVLGSNATAFKCVADLKLTNHIETDETKGV